MSGFNLSLKIQPHLWELDQGHAAFQHIIPKYINTGRAARTRRKRKKKTILATGCEVMRQVLLPATEKQAWRRKEAGRFQGGGEGFGPADGGSLTAEGSKSRRRYEQNGNECGERRKDVSGSPEGVMR